MARYSTTLWCLLAAVVLITAPAFAAGDDGQQDVARAAGEPAGDAGTGAGSGDDAQPSVDELLRKGGATFLDWCVPDTTIRTQAR